MKRKGLLILTGVLAVLLVGLVAMMLLLPEPSKPSLQGTSATTEATSPSTEATEPSSEPTQPPTEPPVTKVSTATISTMGDMLMHLPVSQSGYVSATGEYDLNYMFRYLTPYVTAADLSLANLETTLYGPDWVYYKDGEKHTGYSGYPGFNSPDSLIDAMKNAGYDTILTANNHTYDTQSKGFLRTQQVIEERNLQWIGTKLSPDAPDYLIAEINGIKVGLLCYTYATENGYTDRFSLNGASPMSAEESLLINAFTYGALPKFYTDVEENLDKMAAEGAEATVLFIHWGEEYHLEPVDYQKKMAQELCDLGIDVIVGGHPHVVEPVELLTSTVDEAQKTVCIYSVGNAVSNQRLGNLSSVSTAHTEDGIMFHVTFAKYSDGTVIVESADALPTWVDMRREEGVRKYYILPLDTQVEDWQTAFDLTDETLQKARASYDRTMALVGPGLEMAQQYYAANQAEVEALLGVK